MKYFVLLSSFLLLFWNVENFYDYMDGGLNSSDSEFSSFGEKHWTKKKFLAKCNAISKTVLRAADEEGALPDIVAFAEVENRFVLKKLLSETPLKKTGYKIVHYDSSDHRGIDVALLYNSERLSLTGSSPLKVPVDSTRDILLACFTYGQEDSLAVLVNHFPSKYGGGEKSDNRVIAAERLIEICDSVASEGWKKVVAVGDFNETPTEDASLLLGSGLTSLAGGRGSIKFDGCWELIDQAFVSDPLSSSAEMQVMYLDFLLVKDPAHSGLKPFRTYSGPRYLGGVSDHLPILVRLN